MKLFVVALLALFVTVESNATPYIRFWRGVRDGDKVTQEKFVTDLGKNFLHYTVDVAKGKGGLTAYVPALPPKLVTKPALPDEIALIIYSDEATYKALRETAEGKAYSDAHWKYFLKDKSSSLVPIETSPSKEGFVLESEKAYLLVGDASQIKKGWVTLSVPVLAEEQTEADFRKQLLEGYKTEAADARKNGLRSLITLVSGGYALEYREWESATAAYYFKPDGWNEQLENAKSGPLEWDFGSGFNIQF